MKYWLFKTEPTTYSIRDLQKDKKTPWEGVRNYQARNFMRDQMQIGDLAFIYHSNASPPGIVGIGKVCSKPYPDPTQFVPKSRYYDPKASSESPRWVLVDIAFVMAFDQLIPLATLRQDALLQQMSLLQKGSRLSIQPVTKKEYQHIVQAYGNH